MRTDDGGEGDGRRGGGRNTSSGRRAITPKINPGLYTVRGFSLTPSTNHHPPRLLYTGKPSLAARTEELRSPLVIAVPVTPGAHSPHSFFPQWMLRSGHAWAAMVCSAMVAGPSCR